MPPGQSDPEAVPFSELAGKFLVIEEKVDGAGVSIEFDDSLNLIVRHRDTVASGPEFLKLSQWANSRLDELFEVLENRYIMFGEWMYKMHTVFYNELPDYFLESDIYDKRDESWLSTSARHKLIEPLKINSVPVLGVGTYRSLERVLLCLDSSHYISEFWPEDFAKACKYANVNIETLWPHILNTGPSYNMEGLYIKDEENNRTNGRYKYVRYDFLKKILGSQGHVRDREIIPNQLTTLH